MLSDLIKYISISKKEWNGIIVLIILIIIVTIMPYVYQLLSKDNTINLKDFNKVLAQVNTNSKQNNFDTNKNFLNTKAGYKKTLTYKVKFGEIIEINSANIATLSKIRGIGTTLATRINRYKERLGGFLYKEQLMEVFGIDSLKYNRIKDGVRINDSVVKKININNISFVQLRLFPYLNFNQANAIIEYRNQHGKYVSFIDLKKIAILNAKDLHRMEPYFNFK